MGFDQAKNLKAAVAQAKSAGLPGNKVPVSDGFLTRQQGIENGLDALSKEHAKWTAKCTDAAAMGSAEFKKFEQMQDALGKEMTAHQANVKAAQSTISKLMSEYKADKKIGPIMNKIGTLMNQCDVISRPGQSNVLKQITPKIKPSASAPGPKPGGPTIGANRTAQPVKPQENLYSKTPNSPNDPVYAKTPNSVR